MRYTDFIVNEILPSGEVVHLKSLRAPEKASRGTANSETAQESTQLPQAHSVDANGKGHDTQKAGTVEPEQTLTDSSTSKVCAAPRCLCPTLICLIRADRL
jgi:tRNA pseudouridine13 synthase